MEKLQEKIKQAASFIREKGVGEIEIGLAGGCDSTSVLPIQTSKKLSRALIHSSKAKSLSEKLALFKAIRPADLIPVSPAIKDYSTNLGMGDIAEQMAKNHGISREEQDLYALQSQQRTAQAQADGLFNDEIVPMAVKWVTVI